MVRKRGLIAAAGVLLLLVVVLAAGCARVHAQSAYAGFATPETALETYFTSAVRHDYAITYSAYYQAYHDRVTEVEFIKHRAQAAKLASYSIGPVTVSGDAAETTATLTFSAGSAGGATRTVQVREDLVRQDDGWKIRVW